MSHLSGLTPPLTPSGRSSLVPMPPWHYAGEVISLRFAVDAKAAQTLLPAGFGNATGTAYGHFCDWQSTTDGWELLDPVYAQYKEFFVLIEAIDQAGSKRLYCPLIWVDQDISMMRGLLQGWPKKLGQVWMTRSYGIDHPAAAYRKAGCRMGASLAVKDRRLADLELTLTGAPGERLGFLALPTFGLVCAPSIIGTPGSGAHQLVRARVASSMAGAFHQAAGTLRFYESPHDELSLLCPLGEVSASVGAFALSVTGAEAVAA